MLSAFRCQDDWTSTLLAVDSDVLEQTALEGRWWKNKTGNSGRESHHIFSHNSLLKLIHHLKLYHSVHHSPYLQTWKLARQSTGTKLCKPNLNWGHELVGWKTAFVFKISDWLSVKLCQTGDVWGWYAPLNLTYNPRHGLWQSLDFGRSFYYIYIYILGMAMGFMSNWDGWKIDHVYRLHRWWISNWKLKAHWYGMSRSAMLVGSFAPWLVCWSVAYLLPYLLTCFLTYSLTHFLTDTLTPCT